MGGSAPRDRNYAAPHAQKPAANGRGLYGQRNAMTLLFFCTFNPKQRPFALFQRVNHNTPLLPIYLSARTTPFRPIIADRRRLRRGRLPERHQSNQASENPSPLHTAAVQDVSRNAQQRNNDSTMHSCRRPHPRRRENVHVRREKETAPSGGRKVESNRERERDVPKDPSDKKIGTQSISASS